MAGTLKQVKFKVAFKSYRVGDVITPNGTLRQWLVEQGYADIVEDSAKPVVDRQLKTPMKRAQSGGKAFT